MAESTISVAVEVASAPATVPRSHISEAWELVTIEFGPSELVAFVSDPAAEDYLNTPGLVVSEARLAKGGAFKLPKEGGGSQNVVTPLGTATIKIQDLGGAFSDLIAEKLINGRGTRGKRVRCYRWAVGDFIDWDSDRVGTYQANDRSWNDGYKLLTCVDVRAALKKKILIPRTFKLAQSITSESTTVKIRIVDKELPFWPHAGHYPLHPNRTMVYLMLDTSEVIGLDLATTSKSGDVYTSTEVIRGVFNTEPEEVTIDSETTTDNLPDVRESIYYVEKFPSFLRGLMHGQTFEGQNLYEHWHANMPIDEIDENSLVYAAPDMASLTLRLDDFGEVECKALIEKEVLPFMPSSMTTNEHGEIGLQRVTDADEVGGDVYEFHDGTGEEVGNIVMGSFSAIKGAVSHIKSELGLRYGYNPRTDTYQVPVFLGDADAEERHGESDALIMESKLFHSTAHTIPQVKRLLPAIASRLFGELMSGAFTALPSARRIRVGERVSVTGYPRNDATGTTRSERLSRSVIIETADPNTASGGIRYTFSGTEKKADVYVQTLNAVDVSIDQYRDGATPIRDDLPVGALENIDGIFYLKDGIYPLSFRKKYIFEDGPFYQRYNAEIHGSVAGPMFQLWVPNTWHSDSPRTVVTTGMGEGYGGAPGELGSRGYCIPVRGVGSLSALARYSENSSGDPTARSWSLSSQPGLTYQDYTGGSMPFITLSNNDGALTGFPASLTGYGGVGGRNLKVSGIRQSTRTESISETYEGGEGPPPSAGVFLVARGFSQGIEQKFVTDGMDGAESVLSDVESFAHSAVGSNFYIPPGAGSGPGSVLGICDGNNSLLILGEEHVDAHVGRTLYLGTRAGTPSESMIRSDQYRSHYEALPRTNMANACTRSMYAPPAATVQEYVSAGYFQSLAISRQQDGQIDIITTDTSGVPPSNGNPGDLGIWTADLEGDNAEPPGWIMNDAGVWVAITDWSTLAADYKTLLQLNRNDSRTTRSILSTTRPVGEPPFTHWLDQATGNEYILGATAAEDVLFRTGGVPVGKNLLPGGGNFALDGQGFPQWTATRNAGLNPVNALNRFADDLAEIFITHGVISGEFAAIEGGEEDVSDPVPAPYSLSGERLTTSVRLSWVQPVDMTGIDTQILYRGGVEIARPTSSPYLAEGLVPGSTYSFDLRNANDRGDVSASVSLLVSMPSDSSEQIGITLSNTGTDFRVEGVAYQDNESIVIAQGREITLTLDNGVVIGPESVGENGAFLFVVPAAQASELSKQASIYTNNGTGATQAAITFLFENPSY